MQGDTSATERTYFVRRLLNDGNFLRRQLPHLTETLMRSLRSKIAVGLFGGGGHKDGPACLPARVLTCNPVAPSAVVRALPQYEVRSAILHDVDIAIAASDAQTDEEDKFTKRRWPFLLHHVLDPKDPRAAWSLVMSAVAAQDEAEGEWDAYSASEQISRSLIFLSTLPRSEASSLVTDAFVRFLCRTLERLHAHLEYYGLQRTNNHILNNARALMIGGNALECQAAADAGFRLFREFLPRLVGPHGHLRERSSHYQLIVTQWLLDAAKFSRDQHHRSFLQEAGKRMLIGCGELIGQNGELCALVGDISPDCAPAATVAILETLYPECWPPEDPAGTNEPGSGWYRIAASQSVLFGNYGGDTFPPDYPTHGHNDRLSCVWLCEGVELLADAGRMRYTADPISASQLRASAHNVPIVNGFAPQCESLRPPGDWWPRPYADARIDASIGPRTRRATPVWRHTRTFAVDVSMLNVTDRFDGSGISEITLCWNFGETIKTFDEETMTLRGDRWTITMSSKAHDEASRVTPQSVVLVPQILSKHYGSSIKALGLQLTFRLQLPSTIETTFSAHACAA
jgi:hypothetical protein